MDAKRLPVSLFIVGMRIEVLPYTSSVVWQYVTDAMSYFMRKSENTVTACVQSGAQTVCLYGIK